MSVINTMLKDLERRGADSENAGDKILGGLSSGRDNHVGNESSNIPYLISLLSVIVIVALVIGGYYLSPYKLVDITGGKTDQATAKTDHVAVMKKDKQTQLVKTQASAPGMAGSGQAVVATSQSALHQTQVATKPIPAPRIQKQAPSSVTTAVVATSSTKVTGSVKRVATETPVQVQKKPVVHDETVVVTHHRVSAGVEHDSAENTVASSQVVTKQQIALTPDEKSRQAYATAMGLYKQGKRQEAKSSLTQALAFNPDNADACRLLTVIYLEDGRSDLAADTVEGGLKAHGNDQNLLRLYVQALANLKKYSAAIAVMGQRIQLTSSEDLGYLAGLYQKNNDHLEAVKFYTEALQLVPSKSIWWLGQGISLEILQQYKEAIQSYQKAVSTGELSTRLMEYALGRINIIKKHHADSSS